MSQDDEDEFADGGGYDVDDWSRLKAFAGRVATLDDVQARRAIFALADTTDPRVLDMELPQPLIWWEEDGEQAAVAVQAETHTSADGEIMEVLGLILPDGDSAVARGASPRQRTPESAANNVSVPEPFTLYYTLTFVNFNGTWRIVAAHSSRPEH